MNSFSKKYWFAKICANGHIVDYGNGEDDKFCSLCGSDVFSKCSSCNEPIRGAAKKQAWSDGDTMAYKHAQINDMIFPYYCYTCGNPYQWTQNIIENAVELLSFEDTVSREHKELIKTALADLIVETPKTPVAIAKFNKGFSFLSKPIKDAFYQLLVDILATAAKDAIFPQN